MRKWAKLLHLKVLLIQEFHLTSILNIIKIQIIIFNLKPNSLKWVNPGKDFFITLRNTKNIWENAHLQIFISQIQSVLFNLNTHKISIKEIFSTFNIIKRKRKLLMTLLEKRLTQKYSLLINQLQPIKEIKIKMIHNYISSEKFSLHRILLRKVK